MKTYYNLVIGFVIYAVINSIMLMASLFVAAPAGAGEVWQISANALITALPIGVFTYFLARLMKTGSRQAALVQGAVWAAMQLMLFILVGLGNQTLNQIIAAPGFYVMLVFVFAGPVVQWFVHSGAKKSQ